MPSRVYIPYNNRLKMNILITNDDGIEGEGLHALASALTAAGHTVTVIAPDCNNSAVSHKINMREPMRLAECSRGRGYRAYSLSGSPADCVIFALYALNEKPELVVSGINDGNNLGSDCMYSGTVSGAQEGAHNGIPSIALSTDYRCNQDDFARAAELFVENFAAWTEYARQCKGALNVNIPVKRELKGTRICHTARVKYFPAYECVDPEQGIYRYCVGTSEKCPPQVDEGENDARLFRAGYITLTPLTLDRADVSLIERWTK